LCTFRTRFDKEIEKNIKIHLFRNATIEEYVSSFDLEPAKIYYSFLHNKIFWSSWFLTHGNVGFGVLGF